MTTTITQKRILGIFHLVLRLFLGGMLVFGGIKKFDKPIPAPTSQIEKVKSGELTTDNLPELKIKNYIFGMKQTDYFWQFLGIVEIAFGLLIISQIFGLLGAIMALPITINVFLFHFYLESEEIGELIEMFLILAVNIWLIAYEYPRWKGIIFNKQFLN